MKAIILGFFIVSAFLTACNNNNSSTKDAHTKSSDTAQTTTTAADTITNNTSSVQEVINAYLQLKNALATDNRNDAANAGKQISEAMQKVDEAAFNTDQKRVYDEVKDDIKEHAEHINSNSGKIAHQREHFEMLSKDMYDLVKAVKPSQTLFQDHCPMYNEGKGANWLSEVKEIKNPYLGKKMPDCGTITEEIKK